MRNCAFVDFSNQGLATQAHRQLNGLRFLGKVLSVERAITPPHDTKSQQNKSMSGNDAKPSIDDATLAKDSKQESMTKSLPTLEPIAEKLGVEYPFPPHLVYAYPLPDGNILTNILNAFIVVPRFYTQARKLLPCGRRNAFYLGIMSSVLGAGSFVVRSLSAFLNSFLQNFGISKEVQNPCLRFCRWQNSVPLKNHLWRQSVEKMFSHVVKHTI